MDRVLLLDTNVASAPIHQHLTEAGFEVHVVGRNPGDFLAKAGANYVELDYSDVAATEALIDRLGARFLVPGCNDLSYETCAQISARRGFPGSDPVEAVRTLGDKRAFRRYAAANDIPAPREIAEADAVAGRPVIVKPGDAYSGRGVTALRSPSTEEVDAAVRRARTFSRSGACLIEEFVEGQLHSHTAFLGSDGIVADFIVEEHGASNPFAVDTSRVVFDFDPALLRAVRTAIEQIARDLKLTSGLIHTQFIIDGTRFWIVEITRRCPGDLYSVLIGIVSGLGAVLFTYGLELAKFLLTEKIAGFHLYHLHGEVRFDFFFFDTPSYNEHLWLLLLLPAIGGLAGGYLAPRFAPDAECLALNAPEDLDAFAKSLG